MTKCVPGNEDGGGGDTLANRVLSFLQTKALVIAPQQPDKDRHTPRPSKEVKQDILRGCGEIKRRTQEKGRVLVDALLRECY
jgi:hypothetical protein